MIRHLLTVPLPLTHLFLVRKDGRSSHPPVRLLLSHRLRASGLERVIHKNDVPFVVHDKFGVAIIFTIWVHHKWPLVRVDCQYA